mgnify:CR=1 FL=1
MEYRGFATFLSPLSWLGILLIVLSVDSSARALLAPSSATAICCSGLRHKNSACALIRYYLEKSTKCSSSDEVTAADSRG